MPEGQEFPTLRMSEVTEGMVVIRYGMELLLTDRHERDLDPESHQDADSFKALWALGYPTKIYWFEGIIQNVAEVDAAGLVPRSWRPGNKWRVQGNDLVTLRVIKMPEEQNDH